MKSSLNTKTRAKMRPSLPLEGRVRSAHFNSNYVCFLLHDKREITVPLSWFPKLFNVPHDSRCEYTISADGRTVTWPNLDEEVSLSDLHA